MRKTHRHNGKSRKTGLNGNARTHFQQGWHELAVAADRARDEGYEAFEMARLMAQKRMNQVRHYGKRVQRQTTDWVRNNPLDAIKFSALAGLVMGRWMAHRRRG